MRIWGSLLAAAFVSIACSRQLASPPAATTPGVAPSGTELLALPDYPSAVTGELAHDAVQGIAHDDTHWYLVSTHRIWKVPLGQSLERPALGGVVPFDGRYLHLGDADYSDGALFVPLEFDRRGGPQAIGALRADLSPIGVQPLGGARFAPWCAIDPRTRRLYTSSFDADRIQIFRVELTAERFALAFERDLVLKAPAGPGGRGVKPFGVVSSIQGGAISEEGRLYLASNHAHTGILVFDADTGVWLGRTPVKFSPHWGPFTHQEIEGIDLFDAESAQVPNVEGHLHLLLHDELPKRSYGLMHWRFVVPKPRLVGGGL